MKHTLVLLAAAAASCSAPSATVLPYMALNTLGGSVGSSSVNVGTSFDELGIAESEEVFGGRIDIQGTSSHWSIAHSTSAYAGTGELTVDLELGGFEFEAGADTDTSMEVGATSVLWTHDFGLGDTAHFGLGLGVSALDLFMEIEGEVENPLPGGANLIRTGSMDETLPIPLLGVRLGGDVGPLRLEASYAFLDVSTDEAEVSVTDLDIYTGLDLLGDFGSVIIGYRELAIDATFEDASESADLDLSVGGPYAGIRISF